MAAGAGFMSIVSFGFMFLLFKGWLPYSQDVGVLTNVLIFTLAMLVFGYSFTEARFTLFFNVTGKPRAFMPVYVSRLKRTDVFSIVALIALKYLLKPVGLVSRLGPAADGENFELPELRLNATIKIDEGDEARYDQATAAAGGGGAAAVTAAAGRPLLLPALTTPLMSTLLANRYCPVLVFGAVNTRNRFEFIDPEACHDPVRHLELQHATVMGRLGGVDLPGRRVKRGMEFDIVVEVKAARKGSKEGKVVFRQIFTVLTVLSASTKPVFKAAEGKEDISAVYKWAATSTKALDLEPSAPERWVAVSADYNPIHVSSWMAKLFGFPGRIAHGNHVLACVLERLRADGADGAKGGAQAGINKLLYSSTPTVLEVQFKRPMVLPTKLDIEVGAADGKYALRTLKGEKEYLTAQVAEFKP